MRTVLTALLLVASAVGTAFSITALPFYDDKTNALTPLVVVTGALWLLFALAFWALRAVPVRAAIVLVIAGSVAIGGAALTGPPNTSTDSARYAWDGIVQNAGVSPYAYVPVDPALAHLRTDWLFPEPVVTAEGDVDCVGTRIMKFTLDGVVTCTAINRGTVPTIYPPGGELYFAGLRAVTGPEPTYWPMQFAGLLLSLGVTGILLVALRRRGLDPRWAALWGWSPLVATEGVTNSHVDLVAGVLVLVATLLVAAGRRWSGGIALGFAIAVKLIPVIAAPALLRRQPWKIIVAAVLTFLLLYVPYVLSTGIGVLGYLPGYLGEEGYQKGTRFILVSLITEGPAALVITAVILAVTALLVWWRTDPTNPWFGQVVMIGVTMLAVTPRYAWYALLLVPFIAMTGRWEWMAVPLALTERLLIPSIELARLSAGLAIVLIVVVTLRRAGPGALPRLGRWLRHPTRAPAELSTS